MTSRLAIVGGGPGGYACAFQAAEAEMDVVLIEAAEIGGICLNVGCIPTKLLLGALSPKAELAAQARMRVASGEVTVDPAALNTRMERIIQGTRKAIEKKLAALGVERISGLARLDGPGKLVIAAEEGEQTIEYDRLVLATGSEAAFPPHLAPDGERVISSDEAVFPQSVPESLAVVGGGFIGIELGQVYARLGSKVTIIEALERIASLEDPEISKELTRSLKREGVKVMAGTMVQEVEKSEAGVVLGLSDGNSLTVAKVLVVTGRRPRTKGLGLESVGITPGKRGEIVVDANLMAGEKIYAIGDVNGRVMLAHAADHQAGYVAAHMLGKTQGPYDDSAMPSVIYGSPEAMRVGPTAAQAAALSGKIEVSQAPLAANPIAQAHAAGGGFVKIVWRDGRMVGVSAVGAGVSCLAMASEILIRRGADQAEATSYIYPHPSLDESLLEAAKADREPV